MFYNHKFVYSIVLLIVLLLPGCQTDNREEKKELQSRSGLEFEEYYAIQNMDSLISKIKPHNNYASINCYFFTNTKSIVSILSFVDSMVLLNTYEVKNKDSVYAIDSTICLNNSERKSIVKVIEKTKPYLQPSIVDQLVDDGYFAVVKTFYNRYNIYSIRVFTGDGNKTSQVLFIDTVRKLLKSKGVDVMIGD